MKPSAAARVTTLAAEPLPVRSPGWIVRGFGAAAVGESEVVDLGERSYRLSAPVRLAEQLR